MTEIPGTPPEQRFNLASLIARDALSVGELSSTDKILPYAVAAANNVVDRFQTDKKTGLKNNEAFMNALDLAIEGLKPGEQIGVYVLDVDNFKPVNDNLTHAGGDELLGEIAKTLPTVFGRRTDIMAHGSRDAGDGDKDSIARLGGDEFGVFNVYTPVADLGAERRIDQHLAQKPPEEIVNDWTETASSQANRLNTNLRSSLQGSKFEEYDVGVSVGYANYEPDDNAHTLVAKADIIMLANKYDAKVRGAMEITVTPEDLDELDRALATFDKYQERKPAHLVEVAQRLKEIS